MRIACHVCLTLAAVAAVLYAAERRADACGCLSPPVPVDDGDFAVNQQAEQIIFEVEEANVSAHVLIRYAGSPESFAWILPVPNLPELSLSDAGIFGLLDQATSPLVTVSTTDLCPQSAYGCAYHPAPECGDPGGGGGNGGFVDAGSGAVADASPSGGGAAPVDVYDRKTVGNYDTVIFGAGDAAAAVAWLQSEGFIVNQTMAPYMQPYADAGMLFVAAKLVPGADVTEIHPLEVRYQGTTPMIPLKLTAVAAEPHMTVTAYIFGDQYYRPVDHPLATIDNALISSTPDGRTNYPMVLARAVDNAGGDAFVTEYAAFPILPDFDQGTGCCNSGYDWCGVEYDGVCSCPGTDFDAEDCAREAPGLSESVRILTELNGRHTRLTRLTTRLSPEEMLFDPMFEPDPSAPFQGRLSPYGEVHSLDRCRADILEPWRYDAIVAQQECAATYCGSGECVVTGAGAACACGPGTAARVFNDLDGAPSVTCVPDHAPVDLEAGGLVLPDACAGVSCGPGGTCLDLAGVPACTCAPGYAATLRDGSATPLCQPIQAHTGTAGAQRYTDPAATLLVCAPPPPDCGEFGWLESRAVSRPGVQCVTSLPDPADFEVPDAPTCDDLGLPPPPGSGCVYGCSGGGSGGGYGLAFLTLLVATILRRGRSTAPR